MCGIAGILRGGNGRLDRTILQNMIELIRYRGPDAAGFYTDKHVGLAHARLSIIDLGGGHQPMHNEDKSIWVTYNGEIFNYVELREELIGKGHRFSTQSDTEVLVHLYEEEGEDFVTRINAMAALALWDAKRRRLLLARDRLGKKPLHYALTSEALVFGSEIKALLRHPSVQHELDVGSLARYLVHEYVPAPRTIFAGISKVEPGELIVFEEGNLRCRKYWDVPEPDREEPLISGPALEERIRETLLDSVRRRLMSDVPLGVFLSGGIDSTSVVACMSRAAPGSVRTFSVAFEDPSFDESIHFRNVARYFGTKHEERSLSPDDCLEILPRLSAMIDEPLGDASILPTYLLARFTREHVTVALGGEGGDELLAGYPTYQAHRIAGWYAKLPGPLRRGVLEPMVRRLPVSTSNISLDFKAKRFIAGVGHLPEIRNQIWLGSFSGEEALSLLHPDLGRALASEDLFDVARRHMKRAPAPDLIGRLLYVDLKMYLQDSILVKVDRASMACSLEVRAPLLDYRFVELIARLPTTWKLRGMTTKYILKQAMKPWLPPRIATRAKKGFGIPVADWLRGPLRPLMLDLLSPDRLRRQGLLNPTAVGSLVRGHLEGTRDNRKQLWTLLMLQLWEESWGRVRRSEAHVA